MRGLEAWPPPLQVRKGRGGRAWCLDPRLWPRSGTAAGPGLSGPAGLPSPFTSREGLPLDTGHRCPPAVSAALVHPRSCSPARPHLQPEPKAVHSQPLWLRAGFAHPREEGTRGRGASGKQGRPPQNTRGGLCVCDGSGAPVCRVGETPGDPSIWGSGEARGGQGGAFGVVQGRETESCLRRKKTARPGARTGGGRPLSSHSTPPPTPAQPLCASSPEPVLPWARAPRASRGDPAQRAHGQCARLPGPASHAPPSPFLTQPGSWSPVRGWGALTKGTSASQVAAQRVLPGQGRPPALPGPGGQSSLRRKGPAWEARAQWTQLLIRLHPNLSQHHGAGPQGTPEPLRGCRGVRGPPPGPDGDRRPQQGRPAQLARLSTHSGARTGSV